MKIRRTEIADSIYLRFNGTIKKRHIYAALKSISQEIAEDLADGKNFVLGNFASLEPYCFHGHDGFNVATGNVEYVKPKKTVKAIPHPRFAEMIQKRHERFEK